MVTRAVNALPLVLRVERGPHAGALRVLVGGSGPISVPPPGRLIPRPEGLGVVIEHEAK
jgi:hypothetical protein